MMMTRGLLMMATLLAWSGAASAQVVKIPPIVMPLRTVAPTTTTITTTTKATFGCDAGGAKVCHFRIFYQPRGDRIVILPSGMKADVPGVTIGGNYCMTVGSTPVWKCTRRTINQKYNS
jgi:hypothetical protein